MKNPVLMLVLLLSACVTGRQPGALGNTTGAAVEDRKSEVKLEPVEPQKPASVETQQPVRSIQINPHPRKSEHNIEED